MSEPVQCRNLCTPLCCALHLATCAPSLHRWVTRLSPSHMICPQSHSLVGEPAHSCLCDCIPFAQPFEREERHVIAEFLPDATTSIQPHNVKKCHRLARHKANGQPSQAKQPNSRELHSSVATSALRTKFPSFWSTANDCMVTHGKLLFRIWRPTRFNQHDQNVLLTGGTSQKLHSRSQNGQETEFLSTDLRVF